MIQTIRLENGVRVVLEPIPYLRSAALGIWVLAGSRNETEEQGGISHFIEHMFFKGTARRTAMDIADEMDKVGGQMNAYTTKELTCYFARVLDSHFDTALDVLADMFFNSVMDDAEIEKEKNVILEEINMYEDTPEDVAHDILQSAVWIGDALGRPVLGTQKSVGAFHQKDFKEYLRCNYRPENIVVSVAGRYDEDIVDKIRKYFLKFNIAPDSGRQGYNSLYTPVTTSKEKDVEQMHLCIAFPGIPLGSDDSYALAALNTIFGGGMSSRLFQNIREKRGLAYSIYSFPASYRDIGLYTIYAATSPASAGTVIELVREEIKGLFENRISSETLANTKEQLKSNYMLSLESTSNRMSSNARAELLLNRILEPGEMIDKIDAITLERMYALADGIFDFNKMSLSAVGKIAKSTTAELFKNGGRRG